MKYLIVVVTDGGAINTLAGDHDLERAKSLADGLQPHLMNQVKVLEKTNHGYRIAHIATRPEPKV
jgi:hypothetical protein